jgi:uncharacterized protein (DUF1800 family)
MASSGPSRCRSNFGVVVTISSRWLVCIGTIVLLTSSAMAAERIPPVALTPQELTLVNRITWGASSSTAMEFKTLGAERFLNDQLHSHSDGMPVAAQEQIDGLSISHTPLEQIVTEAERQAKIVNAIADPELKQAAQKVYQDRLNRLGREAATRSLLRDLYSHAQLKEQLTWFWLNHFNVHLYKSNIRAMIGDYEDRAIRPHVLGHFCDLLNATVHHPAMLRYLDNDQNAVGHINENYAREIMELHTMGVGSGYSQQDVQELARIFTGLGIAQPQNPLKIKPELQDQYVRDGLFEFNPNRHDYGSKVFLGRSIQGRGLGEADEAIGILCRAPATARFVSKKLAVYFASEDPPQPLLDAMTDTFRKTNGDIAAVLKTMFQNSAFTSSLGGRFKDPMHYVLSAVRLAYDDRVILNTGPMLGWLGRLAEPLYGHETPDGYPLIDAAWNGPGQMITRFEVARAIGSNASGFFKNEGPPVVEQPAFPLVANSLYFNSIQTTLGLATSKALSQANSPQDWNTLLLSSPEFMRR